MQQEPLEKALDEGKTILETFANGESLDPTLDAANTLKEDIRADHQVEAYFKGSLIDFLTLDLTRRTDIPPLAFICRRRIVPRGVP